MPVLNFSYPNFKPWSSLGWLLVICLITWWSYSAQTWARNLRQESAKEYQIKAVYLYNFSSFITWKPEAFANPQAPFTYCVLGNNPFDKQLDLAMANETVEGHPIQNKYLTQVEQVEGCHVLFIATSEAAKLQLILAQVRKHPILTVSDIPDFIEQGGMIKFYTNQRRQVRMMVDPLTLQEAGLAVSGNLLRVAEVVRR
jgi:hypothetical protein